MQNDTKENSATRTAEVKRMADMVSYQDDSIVSRTAIGKSAGSVTLFAFGSGQSLSEHTTPFDAMLNVLDGEAEITIAGEPFIVKEGEMVVMPANVPHAVMAVKRFKMMLIMIRD